jgi:hypothetical protein
VNTILAYGTTANPWYRFETRRTVGADTEVIRAVAFTWADRHQRLSGPHRKQVETGHAILSRAPFLNELCLAQYSPCGSQALYADYLVKGVNLPEGDTW